MLRHFRIFFALTLAAAGLGSLAGAHQNAPAKNSASIETGRKLFVERCATCHNERGDKPLEKGLPLNQRALTDEVIVKNIEMRFRKASGFERRSVVAYVRSFMKSPR